MTKEEQKKLNDELLTACKRGELPLIKELIAKGAKVDATDDSDVEDWRPLHWVTLRGYLDAVKYLIAEVKAEVDVRTQDEETPLHLASYNGKLEVVKYLIEKGKAEVDARDVEWRTSLYKASKRGKLEVVRYLIEKGAKVDAKDSTGDTPLHTASLNAHLEVVKYLCENDAEVDSRTKDGETPLHFAIMNEHFKVVKYLFLERNALMPIYYMFDYPSDFIQEKIGRDTEAQSIFDYFLQNKHRYKPADIQRFKTEFLEFSMSEEDSKNLKSIIKFL